MPCVCYRDKTLSCDHFLQWCTVRNQVKKNSPLCFFGVNIRRLIPANSRNSYPFLLRPPHIPPEYFRARPTTLSVDYFFTVSTIVPRNIKLNLHILNFNLVSSLFTNDTLKLLFFHSSIGFDMKQNTLLFPLPPRFTTSETAPWLMVQTDLITSTSLLISPPIITLRSVGFKVRPTSHARPALASARVYPHHTYL